MHQWTMLFYFYYETVVFVNQLQIPNQMWYEYFYSAYSRQYSLLEMPVQPSLNSVPLKAIFFCIKQGLTDICRVIPLTDCRGRDNNKTINSCYLLYSTVVVQCVCHTDFQEMTLKWKTEIAFQPLGHNFNGTTHGTHIYCTVHTYIPYIGIHCTYMQKRVLVYICTCIYVHKRDISICGPRGKCSVF